MGEGCGERLCYSDSDVDDNVLSLALSLAGNRQG